MKKYLMIVSLIASSSLEAATLKLRAQYQDSYPKYFHSGIAEQRVVQGLCVDIMKAIQAEDSEIEFQAPPYFVPFKRIQRNLTKTTESAIDVFFGMARDEGRSSDILFIEPPLYEVQHKIAVRKDDPVQVANFDDIRALNGNNRILTNFGTATDRFLKEQDGLDVDADGKDISKNLRKLIDGRKGRFVYFNDIALVSTIKRDFMHNQVRVLPANFRSYFHYLVANRNLDPAITARLSRVLQTLRDKGTLEAIIKRYNSLDYAPGQ
jgi:ABC-type amino acid transport substrate-binding protein